MWVETRAKESGSAPSAVLIDQPFQPQSRDLAEFLADDGVFGGFVVAQPRRGRGEDVGVAPTGGEDQEHVAEPLLVDAVGRRERGTDLGGMRDARLFSS